MTSYEYTRLEFGYPEKFPWWTEIDIPSISELTAAMNEGTELLEREKWEAENQGQPGLEFD